MKTTSMLRKYFVFGIILLFIITNVSHSSSKSSDFCRINENSDFNKKNIHSTFTDSVWLWAVKGGGSDYDRGSSICVDSNGNTYITGYFEGTATFDSTTLISSGGYDILVAKLDTNGNWQWAVKAGGTDYEVGYGICVDSMGNTYITGFFWETATFGSTILTSSGAIDVFVAKIDTNGNWQWAVQGGGIDWENGASICVDSSGNTYITGSFSGENESFGSAILTSSGDADVFVAKIDTNGNWQWAVSGGGIMHDEGRGICVDSSGNTYITGSFNGTATFGSTTITSSGDFDVLVAKLNTTGNWQWAAQGGGTNTDRAWSICVDSTGNTYLTGRFNGTSLFSSITIFSSGGLDVFVAKINTTGNWQWAVSGGGTTYEEGFSICTNYTGGTLITGLFTGTVLFSSTTLTSEGSSDVFVAKIDTNGNWQWAVQGGSTNWEEGWGICVDSTGNAYITGDFIGVTTFGSTTLISSGAEDAFVAKLSKAENQLPVADFTWSPQNPTPGQVITLNASSSYDIDGYITLYEWDWNNDGTFEESCTTPTATHYWSNAGNYPVTLRVNDNVGATNDTIKTIAVNENQPPITPFITGPAKAKIKVGIAYNFTTTDPDGDEVSYYIDWGDGTNSSWIGPYQSGDLITKSHTWSKKGAYTIKAKAKDIHGNESGWGILSVTMPFSYNIPLRFFWERFFERFPNAFPILRQILAY